MENKKLLLPPVQIEITKPGAKLEIMLAWKGRKGQKFIPTAKMDAACKAIRKFMKEPVDET